MNTPLNKSDHTPPTIVEIIHISDLHFGPKNLGRPIGPEAQKSIAKLLFSDLNTPPEALPQIINGELDKNHPIYERLICISGDFTTSGSIDEFNQAKEFLDELINLHGWSPEHGRNRILIIPGNHDLSWNEKNAKLRWQNWRVFHDDFYDTKSKPEDPLSWVQVRWIEETKTIVVCFDSEHHIHAGSEYKHCGFIEDQQLAHVFRKLEELKKIPEFDSAAKIAMVHHHPILIPSLAEPGRGVIRNSNQNDDLGYDAIYQSQKLLNLLHVFGFHVLLHGHKHMPHVFTEDIVNACHKEDDHSMIIVAAGTLSSDDKIGVKGWGQSYNKIHLHWNNRRKSTRVHVETRRLVTVSPEGHELLWPMLKWEIMRKTDRFSSPWLASPTPNFAKTKSLKPLPPENISEIKRCDEYKRLGGNMPVVEVRPSLVPGQGYEAKFWITYHTSPQYAVPNDASLLHVTWSAGPKFPRCMVFRKDDPKFCGAFHCYGPMLIQAELHFSNRPSEIAHIYANLPEISN